MQSQNGNGSHHREKSHELSHDRCDQGRRRSDADKGAGATLRWREKHEAAYERSLSGLRNVRLLRKLMGLQR
jgi:hypothetical protein